MSDTSVPEPPVRRTSGGVGPLLALAVVVIVGAVGLRAWQVAGQGPGKSPSPSSSGQLVSPSPTGSPAQTPTPAPSATASIIASPSSDDSGTARSVVTQYETARASGDFKTAWSMLSAFSQSVIGSLAKYEQLERAYNNSGGTIFEIQAPTQNPDLLAPEFLGLPYLDAQAKADISRAWLVYVSHPKVRGASAGAEGLLLAPIGDHWYVWIAH